MLNRVAKAVIFGSLLNNDMAEEVHRLARKVGTVCSVTYPLPAGELQHHGMMKSEESLLYISLSAPQILILTRHMID